MSLLEPFRAKQLDATVEWYFDRDSALMISGFYKDLSTFIVQQVTPLTVPNPAGGPALEGTFRQPINGSGGTIKGVEARVAFRYRSSYATELGDTDRILFTAPEPVLDFQTSYEFAKGSRLDGVKLLFQANNLTDEPFETYYGDRRLQGRYERFGRRILLGVGYQF